jgi:hypothetical protein
MIIFNRYFIRATSNAFIFTATRRDRDALQQHLQ